jgi:PKD repeat protein
MITYATDGAYIAEEMATQGLDLPIFSGDGIADVAFAGAFTDASLVSGITVTKPTPASPSPLGVIFDMLYDEAAAALEYQGGIYTKEVFDAVAIIGIAEATALRTPADDEVKDVLGTIVASPDLPFEGASGIHVFDSNGDVAGSGFDICTFDFYYDEDGNNQIELECHSSWGLFDGLEDGGIPTKPEEITTNLVVDYIFVTSSNGSATISVSVGYPQGESSSLDVEVGLLIYHATDYAEGNPPIGLAGMKYIDSILRGDSRPITFTWDIISNGDYIFVAVVDYDNVIDEINEADNSYPSLSTNLRTLVIGCMDPEAVNYDEDAEVDDGSCEYAPPLPVAIAGKEVTVDESEVVQFSGAGTIENGTIVLYEWDFDGDGVFEWSSKDNGITTFIYNDVGKYVATLRVTDNLGATAIDNKTIRVVGKADNIEEDDSGISVPSITLISSIAAVAVIALRRRY